MQKKYFFLKIQQIQKATKIQKNTKHIQKNITQIQNEIRPEKNNTTHENTKTIRKTYDPPKNKKL